MNWKTTLTAAISAAASFVLFAQFAHYTTFPPLVVGVAAFAQIGGLTAFGIVAKDYNVTGGTVGQPSSAAALTAANQAPSIANPPPHV